MPAPGEHNNFRFDELTASLGPLILLPKRPSRKREMLSYLYRLSSPLLLPLSHHCCKTASFCHSYLQSSSTIVIEINDEMLDKQENESHPLLFILPCLSRSLVHEKDNNNGWKEDEEICSFIFVLPNPCNCNWERNHLVLHKPRTNQNLNPFSRSVSCFGPSVIHLDGGN